MDAAALAVAGYCTQAAFLLANGIEADLATSEATLEHARLASQARQLLLPGEMGETLQGHGTDARAGCAAARVRVSGPAALALKLLQPLDARGTIGGGDRNALQLRELLGRHGHASSSDEGDRDC